MERRFLIGHDPSLGDDALVLGGLLAHTLAARPLVATVFRAPRNIVPTEEGQRAVESQSAAGFEAARERLAGLAIETRAVVARSPAEGLHRLAEEEHANLLVLGSARGGKAGRLGLGDVVEAVLRGAPCAVAVAPRDYGRGPRPRLAEVAVAFDGSAEAWAALETGIGIAERSGGELTIITVAVPPRYGYASAWAVLSSGEIHDFERESKQRVLELALARVGDTVPVRSDLETGYPGSTLAESSANFDLIVAGSRGYGPLRRALLGSSTRELMRNGGCPVMILPRAASIDPLGARPEMALRAAG